MLTQQGLTWQNSPFIACFFRMYRCWADTPFGGYNWVVPVLVPITLTKTYPQVWKHFKIENV
jgi:hypothetical protein